MTGRRGRYALLALAVFALEAAIALFVRDRLVRPLVGDALAVVLVYLALRAATRLRPAAAIALALVTAFVIEAGQLLGLIDLLGLSDNTVARVVLGAQFDPLDLTAYCLGAAGIAAAEAVAAKRTRRVQRASA
ncbi:DUF2809 domain-containing protein [Sphingomonas parva]|uniref:DUF2809 domain-containing protein n=1 Tax=Sphingomonas parva TaxID=2555898 RepID=A0A4Y8ZQM9_9SPHN|nr:DUF2809 domain-containing protein [Sphingomonas parva]TFI57445.1 DUF2809 domain-containing protein [Sphingomonas parva]